MKDTIKTIERLSASDKLRYKLEAEEDAKRIYKSEIYDAKQQGEALGIEKGEALGIKKGKSLGIEEGRALGIEEGKLEGLKEGELIGAKNRDLNIARKMKKSGFDSTLITEMTGLTKEEINAIE